MQMESFKIEVGSDYPECLRGEIMIWLTVKASDTIDNVKTKIIEQGSCVSHSQLRLHFAEQQLEDSRTLSDYNIQKGAILNATYQIEEEAEEERHY